MQIIRYILSVLLVTAVSAQPLIEKREIPTDIDIKKILHAHNKYRAHHDAQPLSWDANLATFASDWSAHCETAHSGGPHGENMAFNQGSTDWEAMVDLWYNEVKDYDFNNPGFKSNTGHFTQVVWKDTSSIGCGITNCPNINFNVYVCEYEPRGNVLMYGDDQAVFFKTNVTKSTV